MLDKMKHLGAQVATKATDAVEGITTSVRNTAGNVTDALNDKAVRASTAQVCSIPGPVPIQVARALPSNADDRAKQAEVNGRFPSRGLRQSERRT